MREVYRAKDTRLEREVAIKVLPEELADDEDRMRRFEREAKTLASISKAGGTIWSQEFEGLGRGLESRSFLEAS